MREIDPDSYKTVRLPSPEILLKEKKSKFYGYAFPLAHENEVKSILESLKRKHPTANHFCYAWQLGIDNIHYRANDDREPYNTSGMPIYGQIKSFSVTNILLVVVRIFGGTKLGAGGLINAYKTAAYMALEAADIVEKTQDVSYILLFGYPEMDVVMRTIKQRQLKIISQQLQMDCKIVITIEKRHASDLEGLFGKLPGVTIKPLIGKE